MKTMSVPFLAFLSFVVLIHAEPDTLTAFGIPYNQFYCGPSADPFFMNLAISQLNSTCPAAAPELNHCCAIHDDCYLNQRGKDECDRKFCDCLDYVQRHVDHATECKKLTDLTGIACSLVKSAGSSAYNLNSSALEAFEHKNIPSIPKIGENYAKLYESCDTQKVTLGSCALNYDICVGKNATNCAIGLIRCLDDTQIDRDQNAECDKDIERIQDQLLFSKEANLSTPNIIVIDVERKVAHLKVHLVHLYRQASRPGNSIYFYLVGLASIFIVGILVLVACVLMDRTDEEEPEDFYPSYVRSGKSTMSTMSTSAARSR